MSAANIPESSADLTIDDVLDFANTIVDTAAKANRRDSAMNAAHAAGLDACEVCGRGIKNAAVAARVAGSAIGPECLRKMRKAGLPV